MSDAVGKERRDTYVLAVNNIVERREGDRTQSCCWLAWARVWRNSSCMSASWENVCEVEAPDAGTGECSHAHVARLAPGPNWTSVFGCLCAVFGCLSMFRESHFHCVDASVVNDSLPLVLFLVFAF